MSAGAYIGIGLAIGGFIGLALGWLLGRGRGGTSSDARLENELRQQIAQREAELTQLRGQLTEAGNARAAAEASRQRRKSWSPNNARCRTRRCPICARRSAP